MAATARRAAVLDAVASAHRQISPVLLLGGSSPGLDRVPSSRAWSWETDIQDPRSAAHDTFISADDAIRVSVWEAPFDASSPIQSGVPDVSRDDLVAWVESYCERSGNSPCDGISGRAVELCLEKADCHPGLLVPFENDVQAFFTAGIYSGEAMTVVTVWERESAPSVAPYGGAQQLLESFLVTMQVWPSSTPRDERACVEVPEPSFPGECIGPP